MSLITISDIELRYSTTIVGTSTEELYTYLIDAVQEKAEAICNRNFDETEYTERLDGNGQFDLLLPEYPVVSVDSIQTVDTDGSVTDTFLSTDYVIDNVNGSIFYKYGFPKGRYNIKVVYTAGYGTESGSYAVPEDLKETLLQMIEQTKTTIIKSSDLKSESLGDYSYTKNNISEIKASETQIFTLKFYMKID